MSQNLLIWLDGKLVPESEAKISVFDHGLLYGDGVFEGIRIYNGRVFRLTEHLHRLYDCAKAICLTIPMTFEELEKATVETVAANKLRGGYIRLVVTRGVGSLGLNPYQCPKASVFIIASTPPRAAAVCTKPLRPERTQAVTNTMEPPFSNMK